MDERNEWKLNELPELAKKDIYKPVYLNKYGYYELRRQNTREERNKNFEEHYFQEYAGATYEKAEYPPDELQFLNNQIEERAYVIEQNLAKTGVSGDYSLLDTMGFFVGHVTHAWVINELLGRKIAELEKGANDENITAKN